MQPVPESPINVQYTNPHVGLDRGLFKLRTLGEFKYARIHAVKFVSRGPNASLGVLEYKVMQYKTMPKVAADYAGGTIATASGGGQWFDTLCKGTVTTPIVAEYWAIKSFLDWYSTGGVKLETVEKNLVNEQAQLFVNTMGSFAGLKSILLTTVFDAVAGNPLTKTSQKLDIVYSRNNVDKTLSVMNITEVVFDPVRIALNAIKDL